MKDIYNNAHQAIDWEVTTNRYIGFVDIMGFKDLVGRTDHIKVYSMMKDIYKSIKIIESVKWRDEIEGQIYTTMFSDSIIIYTKDDSYNSLNAIISATSALMYELIINKIPYKGAMAFGKMTVDQKLSIFFGQPLIDAYLLQEEAAFYGFVIHGTAEEKIHQYTISNQRFISVMNYNCPFKNGRSTHLTIHPLNAISVNADTKKKQTILLNAFIELKYRTSGSLRKYIDATDEYINVVKNRSSF